jgi:outer membrane lipoprotein-sorting protein
MRTLTLGLTVMLALAVVVPAVAQETALPSADQVLDKYVAATGGKEAIEKVTSRVSKGTMDVVTFGASGTFEQYAKEPGKVVTISDFPGFGTVIQCYDGKAAWMSDPQQGFRELSGPETAVYKRSADLQAALHMKDQYKKLTVTGKAKVGEREAYVMEAQPAEGDAEKYYFDTESGLLTRMDMPSPQGSGTVTLQFEDFKDVDGVKIPCTIHQDTPEISLLIKIEDVKQNVPIDDAKFSKPAPEPEAAPAPAPAAPQQ